jgi:hypothetical protein
MIDLDLTKLDFTIHKFGSPYSRHLALLMMAFEPGVNDAELLAAAQASNHLYSILLRSAVLGGASQDIVMVPPVNDALKASHSSYPAGGSTDDAACGEWVTANRWEWCTGLVPGEPSGAREQHNGLDFMSLEVLMRTQGVLR